MSIEKFTPGEWWVSGMVDFSQPVSFDAAIETNKTFIAFLATQNKDELNANAALIAAAPEMYKELENIEDYLRFLVAGCVAGSGRAKALWALIDRIIAIRKKARGEE